MLKFRSKFSIKNYEGLMRNIKQAKLKCISFQNNIKKGRNIIMRHDVDFCPQRALEIAEIENKHKVKATYFFMINSEFYNIHSYASKKALKKISKLGHFIGLHFDASLFHNRKTLLFAFRKELKTLENIINKKIKIASFHRPSKKFLSYNRKYVG